MSERLSEIPPGTEPETTGDSVSKDEVNVNYTISSPLRKTLRASFDKEDDDSEQKISASFTILPPSRSNTNLNSTNQMPIKLEKVLDSTSENSVSAIINVPLISSKNPTKLSTSNSDEINDRIKKTEQSPPPPIPQPRSLFDIDNATSIKLADKLQLEASKCDVNAIGETQDNETFSHSNEPLPPFPIPHHTVFGERRPSWRLKNDYYNKVN